MLPQPPVTTRVLLRMPTSVTGAELLVDEGPNERGVMIRGMHLGGYCQSEAEILSDGTLSFEQPLELVQHLVLVSLCWLRWLEAGTASMSTGSPRVLLVGLGGGSVARALLSLDPSVSLHCVELEPEVITVAHQHFGLPGLPRCTTVAGEAGEALAGLARKCKGRDSKKRQRMETETAEGGDRDAFEIVILDAFSADGLAESVRDGGALRAGARCIRKSGLLLVNLHTAQGTGALRDADYATSRAVLRRLCEIFDVVLKIECAAHQNVLALCHYGEMQDVEAWGEALSAQLRRAEVRAMCPEYDVDEHLERFDYVGGRHDLPDVLPDEIHF